MKSLMTLIEVICKLLAHVKKRARVGSAVVLLLERAEVTAETESSKSVILYDKAHTLCVAGNFFLGKPASPLLLARPP